MTDGWQIPSITKRLQWQMDDRYQVLLKRLQWQIPSITKRLQWQMDDRYQVLLKDYNDRWMTDTMYY